MRRLLPTMVAGLAVAFGIAWLTGIGLAAPAPDAIDNTTTGPSGDSTIPADDTMPPVPDTKPDDNGIAPSVNSGITAPEVLYDVSALPKPVARIRQQIIDAAATGDPQQLRPIIDAQTPPPLFGPNDIGDPIGYLKLESGDEGGREILAILTEVLEAGFVHVDIGTPSEVYLWPYFARVPIDSLTPRQLVELFKLVYAGDYEDMLSAGQYTYFRVGIAPDGTWRYFVTDE